MLVCSILCNNLKKAFPDAEIHYMVYESTIQVLEGNTSIDKLIHFTEKERKSKLAFFRFLLQIRKEKYDVLIDSYSKLESWLTTFFSGAKRRISYSKPGRNFLYTDIVNTYDRPLSNLGLIIERRLSLLDPLNLNVVIDPVPKLYITDAERHYAKELMLSHGLDESKNTIMMSIIGSSDIKTYPLNYMSELIDFIVEQTHANILFNYIPNQLKEAREIYEGCRPSTQKHIFFDLLGKNLREYIALMNECDMIIGNDGGAINMAKALNKSSFIIFSPWIRQEMWATFEDNKFHKSVHLEQFKPKVFRGMTEKELKRDSLELYQHFKPEFVYGELESFLNFNLKHGGKLNLSSLIKPLESTNRKQVSAIIISKNEAENLPSLIRNLQFANEIILVDSFSNDSTREIVKNYPEVKFTQREFNNYSDQRNFAIDQAQYNWILFIDADERIPKSLQYEIQKALSTKDKIIAYEMYRQFYFGDKPLKYGGFQTDKVVRLFDRRKARYDALKLVHEILDVNGETSTLKSKLLHFSFKDQESYRQKLITYGKLRAEELYAKNVKPTLFHMRVKPLYRFLYHYIIRRGFLDGKAGYIMAKLNAYGVKQRFVELKKIKVSRQ